MTIDPTLAGALLVVAFTFGSWWGIQHEHGNWLLSARAGTSRRGRDGVFYRVEPEQPGERGP
jgi:hypothetical protein